MIMARRMTMPNTPIAINISLGRPRRRSRMGTGLPANDAGAGADVVSLAIGPGYRRCLPLLRPRRQETMSKQDQHSKDDDYSWKKRIGVEFSGLERSKDFLVAIGVGLGLVAVAMAIAFIAFR